MAIGPLAQDRGRVVGRNKGRAVDFQLASSPFCDAPFPCQGPEGYVAECDDKFWGDPDDFVAEFVEAFSDLGGVVTTVCEGPVIRDAGLFLVCNPAFDLVAGRTILADVRDITVFALDADFTKHTIEFVAGSAHEGYAELFFLFAGGFSDDHDSGVGRPG